MKTNIFLSMLKGVLKGVLPLTFFALLPLSVSAQEFEILRGGCMPDITADGAANRAPSVRRIRPYYNAWDPNRTFRQLVILINYGGDNVMFSMDDPKATYNSLFNETGYNQRNGVGCVAEYLRDQSNGKFNVVFDVFGPYTVSEKAQPYENPDSNTKNYQSQAKNDAVRMLFAEYPNMDFSPYDWNNDGAIEQVIFIHAGYTGNVSTTYGYVWPSSGDISPVITTPDGKKINYHSSSAELWPSKNPTSCGLGTICHEYLHCFGLPDIYPVPSWTYSAVDEWDLMDGGNFTNYGWCPPNLSPLEKMLLGWLTPVELTAPTSVVDLKPVADGGVVYQVKHTDSEYLLLENRQWSGWDLGLPGKGLVIYHVNYNAKRWENNNLNGTKNAPFNYSLVHADNMDYNAWVSFVKDNGLSHYANKPWLNSLYLSGSPYPYVADGETLDSLTDTSVPAAKMITMNDEGSYMLSKPITHIKMSEEGLVSFDFMGGDPTSTDMIRASFADKLAPAFFDLNGCQLPVGEAKKGLCIVRLADGTVKKVFK